MNGQSFVVPLALPGDDVTPEKFVTFWCDGKRGLYIHPNIWHGAIVPHDDHAEFLDRQGRVHARVSVNFPKELGCDLATPLGRVILAASYLCGWSSWPGEAATKARARWLSSAASMPGL
jgi:hypothetical protein